MRLEFIIREGLKRFDTLVLTGGLGPTKDDLTKQTVAKVLNKNLVTNEEALNYIEDFFKEQGQEMTPNNKQQALVVEGAKVLKIIMVWLQVCLLKWIIKSNSVTWSSE